MFDPKKFTVPKAKPLPVCLLLDVSYSMSGSKIDNLNRAVAEMIKTFAAEEKMEIEILISIISFGGEVKLEIGTDKVPFVKASEIEWNDLIVSGMTPMGTALQVAKSMIEDKDVTPSRAYRPTIILVSDGEPTDDWKKPLDEFINSGRSSKCDRMAMAIGSDANDDVLKRFIKGTTHELFYAEDAAKLHEFFNYVTMSVTMRTKSQNPNQVPDANVTLDAVKEDSNQTTDSSDDGYW